MKESEKSDDGMTIGSRQKRVLAFVVIAVVVLVGAALWADEREPGSLFSRILFAPVLVFVGLLTAVIGIGAILGIKSYLRENRLADEEAALRIEKRLAEVRVNPGEPRLAWDLAQTRLESYWQGNLRQSNQIFLLTLAVMMMGFMIVVTGIVAALLHPDKLDIAKITSVSGVLVSFLGGSFLLVYSAATHGSKCRGKLSHEI